MAPSSSLSAQTVHPRACGEHPRPGGRTRFLIGSSPRLRGTPSPRAACIETKRFIPAPAGNTAWARHPPSAGAVHPRACGEHLDRVTVVRNEAGSSPRLRGTRLKRATGSTTCRFIPAPAGNTGQRVRQRAGRAVHPRACGEHVINAGDRLPRTGSSPRLRGTRGHSLGEQCSHRFIPAPAGNTVDGRRLPLPRLVHPRACGEHKEAAAWNGRTSGSSPRLRGTQSGKYRRAQL